MVKTRLLDKFFKSNSFSKNKKTDTNTDLSQESFETRYESELFNLINENLSCNCCFDILRYPVTLICGHTFCQLCLANWYMASESNKCPTCRQEWTKIPHVNCVLKSTIKAVVSHELIQPNMEKDLKNFNDYLKKCDNLNQEEINKIKSFEKKFSEKFNERLFVFNNNINNENNINNNGTPRILNRPTLNDLRENISRSLTYGFYIVLGFVFGILVGFTACSLFWFVLSAIFPKDNSRENFYENQMKIRRKYALETEEWSSNDIQEWLTQLGPWTDDILYSAKVSNLGNQYLKINFFLIKESNKKTRNFSSRW